MRGSLSRLLSRAARTVSRQMSTAAGATAKRSTKVGLAAVGVAAASAAGIASYATGTDGAFTTFARAVVHDKPAVRNDLPTIPLSELQAHYTREGGVWVSYRGAVYDVTSFLDAHPGGTTRLMMAAGSDLEPYWSVYGQHFRGHLLMFMDNHYRIGNLSAADAAKAADFEFGNAYETDPDRVPDLLTCMPRPFCGEPRLERLTETYYTPCELFYVRNHLPVAVINPNEYELVVKGNGVTKHKFSLTDIKTKWPQYEVVSTLQCAGNRREDFHDEKTQIFISPHWVSGAISCAKWKGPRLRDVLRHCGLDVDGLAMGTVNSEKIQHIQFEGYDVDETGLCYGGSIPIDKAVDPLGDCILAWEMNGQTLPRDHGYPVRALSPGHAGARQCKWLHKIIVADHESKKPWHQKSYRGFAPDITFDDLAKWPKGIRLDQAQIIQEMPVQSLVCQPLPSAIYKVDRSTETVKVKGVAWSGGGKGIVRVDVSIDGGDHFTAAELYKPVEQRRNRQWGWTQFEKDVSLTETQKKILRAGQRVDLVACSKAVSSNFDVQPIQKDGYYNARGVCINHCYMVPFSLDPSIQDSVFPTRDPNTEFANVPTGGKFVKPWLHHGFDGPMNEPTPKKNIGPKF